MKSQKTLQLLIHRPMAYDGQILSASEILSQFFEPADAFWMHDGNPKNPHAELTSGMCSNAFFDCMWVLCYPNICEIFARQLVSQLRSELTANGPAIDWVVSSSSAAITFGHELAKAFCAQFGFTEKTRLMPRDKFGEE